MPATHPTSGSIASQANDLYWNSGHTVEGIMTDLGLSKNSLYSSIEPYSTGRSCATCGGLLVFTNRTHRDAGRGTCSTCGLEVESVDAAAHASHDREIGADGAHRGRRRLRALRAHDDGRRWSRLRDDFAAVEPERVALVGGAAALGVMVGAAAARAVREML